MKRKICLVLIAFIILPCVLLFAGCDKTNSKDIELRVAGEYVQWSYENENTWKDIITVDEIKSLLGNTYKGDKGEQGVAGKQVEFRVEDGYIQWHYVNDTNWINLISTQELKTDIAEEQENEQGLAFYLLDDGTYGVGAGTATQLSTIIIPETYKGKPVTKIVSGGFDNCSKLNKVILCNNIFEIGSTAFFGCKLLDSIEMKNSIKSIGANAFFDCISLKSITISDSVTSIGSAAFYNCISLTAVTIPNSVTSIGSDAFYNCILLANVNFINKIGWKADSTSISSEDLSNLDLAAQYLKNTYCDYDWIRE